MTTTDQPDTNSPKPRGPRNLIVLGLAATIIAIATTAISLTIYHNSGDIYLDRSRPGFLPDEKEAVKEADAFRFEDSGPIDAKTLEEYLQHLKVLQEDLKDLDTPYSETPLTDKSLGVPTE